MVECTLSGVATLLWYYLAMDVKGHRPPGRVSGAISRLLDGTFVLRACIINPRTQPGDLEYLVALVRELGAQLAGGGV